MASDAGKLIALSLGKIADSRKQRGGINLCKNLLVSTVLFKARSIYMMENYQQIAEARKQTKEAKNVQKSPEKVRETKVESVPEKERVESSDLLTCTVRDPDTSRIPENDKENIVPINKSNSSQTTSSEKMECDSREKESCNVKSDEKLSVISDNAQCLKCTKRRRSEVEDNANANLKSRADDSGSAKRSKIDSPTSTSDCTQQKTQSPEPMITEPAQISNLVQIFNTGFAGLCEQQNNAPDYTSSQTCVKQVPSFVENLNRPVIALAV